MACQQQRFEPALGWQRNCRRIYELRRVDLVTNRLSPETIIFYASFFEISLTIVDVNLECLVGEGLLNHDIDVAVMIDVQGRNCDVRLGRLEFNGGVIVIREMQLELEITYTWGRYRLQKHSSIRPVITIKIGNRERRTMEWIQGSIYETNAAAASQCTFGSILCMKGGHSQQEKRSENKIEPQESHVPAETGILTRTRQKE